jgi:hypothetical protein
MQDSQDVIRQKYWSSNQHQLNRWHPAEVAALLREMNRIRIFIDNFL